MERIIDDDERIRRAEEVLNRRKNYSLRISGENFENKKNNLKLKKIVIQVSMCFLIYISIFCIKNYRNNEYKIIDEKLDYFLNYDVNFKEIYGGVINNFNNLKNKVNEQNDSDVIEQNIDADNNINNEAELVGVGGGNEEDISNLDVNNDIDEEIDNIKKVEFIKPLSEYVITSRYGNREPNDIISANHKGIDLGAANGSDILSATNGIVIEANELGDYGKHVKIKKDGLTLVYAHCSKILVNENQEVKIGEKIAEVGATGKATGPHLHFEIRKDNVAINPESIIEF